MNKIIPVALVAALPLLLQAPDAAAHDEIRFAHYPTSYQQDVRRMQMPKWLRRDRAFRHWYKNTRLRRHRHVSWHRLFDIYRWETRDSCRHRRTPSVAWNHGDYRHHDRDTRWRRQH